MQQSKTFRGVLINPRAKTITTVEVMTKWDEESEAHCFDYDSLVGHVSTGLPHRCYIEAVRLGGGIVGYVDEEGLLTDWDGQCFFGMAGGTFAGNMLLVREDNHGQGIAHDFPVPIEVVQAQVQWLHPKEVRVPAPTFTSYENGVPKTVPLDPRGVSEWTYDCQPSH